MKTLKELSKDLYNLADKIEEAQDDIKNWKNDLHIEVSKPEILRSDVSIDKEKSLRKWIEEETANLIRYDLELTNLKTKIYKL